MTEPFPWVRSHFTLREADIIERFRETYPDHLLWTHKGVKWMALNRTREEVTDYLRRNPRKPREAA